MHKIVYYCNTSRHSIFTQVRVHQMKFAEEGGVTDALSELVYYIISLCRKT